MTTAALASRPTGRTLVRASLELGRVLADRDGVTFRARGTCMYPSVRAGDVLRIKSCAVADVATGDIAVCRRSGALFGHRVISKGVEEGRAYIVTRPDLASAGSDGRTFDESLLGVVVAIERKGKPVPLLPAEYPWPVRRFFALRRTLLEAAPPALLRLAQTRESVQASALYRALARGWMALARPRVSYSVRLPMPALGDSVYRRLSPETFDVRMDWRGRPVERWTLTLHLDGKRQPAAWATFARVTTADWRVVESHTRARYRGAGLDEALLRQADAILMRGCGAPQRHEGRAEHPASS